MSITGRILLNIPGGGGLVENGIVEEEEGGGEDEEEEDREDVGDVEREDKDNKEEVLFPRREASLLSNKSNKKCKKGSKRR